MNDQDRGEEILDLRDKKNSRPFKKAFINIIAVVFEFIKTTLSIIILAAIIRLFIIQPFIVDGQSMLPNFHDKDYLITEKVSYRFSEPQRGDIIIFNPPDAPNINYIKRIIGLPGETVEIKNSNVYINGKKLVEPYLAEGTKTQTIDGKPFKITLESGQYFVMGDNRDRSRDCREIGSVERSNIISKTWVTLFPFSDFNFTEHYNFEEGNNKVNL